MLPRQKCSAVFFFISGAKNFLNNPRIFIHKLDNLWTRRVSIVTTVLDDIDTFSKEEMNDFN